MIFSKPPELTKPEASITSIRGSISSLQRRETGFRLTVGNILVYLSDDCISEGMSLYPGNRVQVAGTLGTFSSPRNLGQFDEFSYYKSKNIDYVMWAKEIELLSSRAAWGQRGLFWLRERLVEVYFQILPEKEAGTLAAMVLGEKAGLSGELRGMYQQAGLGHLLAISGLHISIAAMAVYQGVLLLKGSKRLAAALGIGALLFYGVLTGFSISASRAVLMLFLALAAEILGRSYDRETALAFSAIWILLRQPGQLFQSGFLLSFGAVLGAGTVYPVLEQGFLKKKDGEHTLKLTMAAAKGWLKRAVLFQVAVSLATVPMILWFYYEIPVYGMVLNIFLVPLMSLVTGGGILAGIVGTFSLRLGRFLVGGVWFLLNVYEKTAEFSLSLPFAVWNPGRPSVARLLLYGLGLMLTLSYIKRKDREAGFLPALELGLLLLLLLLPKDAKGLELTVLDVGQGDGIWLSCEEGLSCLIDGGSSSEKELYPYCLLPFLKYKGKARPDYVFVTHMDEDHVSGVRELAEAGAARCLVLPADVRGDEKAEKLARLGEENGMDIWWIKPGEGIKKGKFKLTCLAPSGIYDGSNENAASLVLLLEYGEYGEFRGLFTGDLEQEGEEALLRLALPDCDFLKVAHHGSDYTTSEELLQRIQPEIAVISCGENNSYGHPGKELLARLAKAGCRIYQTPESGAVTLRCDGREMEIVEFKK